MFATRIINPGEVYYPLPKTPPVKPVEPIEGSPGMNNDQKPGENYDLKNNERQSSQPHVDIAKLLRETFFYDDASRCAMQQCLIGSKLDVTVDSFGFKKPQKLDVFG
ncbi:hypothetical protein HZA97_04015 [Candidatus Woesearchaeota archaeon]|nr:hypothetical protein [Candidatus Woesearchaeota archaeon]